RRLREETSDKVILPELENSAKNIAFLQPERVRFYKRAFAGARFRMNFWENLYRQADIAPATFDVTLGFDQAIREGYFPRVASFEGFVPFPFGNNFVYFYGGGSLALTREDTAPIAPLYMEPGVYSDLGASSTIVVPGVKHPFVKAARDTYFFGIGIDLLKLFSSGTVEKKQ